MWNWYQWDSAELFEIWHSNFISDKDLGPGSLRYTNCLIDLDGKAKAMVEEEYAESLVNCNEPEIINIKPI